MFLRMTNLRDFINLAAFCAGTVTYTGKSIPECLTQNSHRSTNYPKAP